MSRAPQNPFPTARAADAGSGTPARIRVLILEDNPSDADLMVDALVQAGFDPEWELVDTEADFSARLTRELDLILSDYALPQFTGPDALRIVRARGMDVPFILVSGSIGEDIAVQAMQAGADDYLLKDRMARLGSAVVQALLSRRLRAERERAESEWRESEERFRQLAENITEVFFLIDTDDTRVYYVSPAYQQIWGRTRESLIANPQSWADSVHPEDRGRILAANSSAAATGRFDYTYRIVRPDGSMRWIHARGFPVLDETGKPYRTAGIAEDITERKRAQRVLDVLSGVNSAIVRIRDRQNLLEETCRIAVEHGKFKMVVSGILDRTTLDVVPSASAGLDAGFLSELRLSARKDVPGGQGATGEALRSKRSVWDNDLTAGRGTGALRQRVVNRGVRSMISLPLLVEGEAEGVIVLYAEEVNFFTADEIRVLEEVASNISFALEHIIRQQNIEKLSRVRALSSGINSLIVRVHDRQELFDEACRIAVELGNFGIAWIGTFDPNKLEIAPVASAGLPEESALRTAKLIVRPDVPQRGSVGVVAIRERRPVYNNDIARDAALGGERRKEAIRRGYLSAIALPLIVDGAIFGMFLLFARERDFFDDEEVRLLTELAGNISLALEHMSRRGKLDKLSRIRAVSAGINAAIVRIRERETLLQETCRIAAGQGQFELVWVGEIDQEGQKVRPVASTGFSREAAHAVTWASIGAARGTLGEAILTRKPAVRNDISVEMPAGKLRHEALHKGCDSTVCLPLVVDDKVVAAIILFATGKNFFDEEELALLNELTSDVCFALQTIARQERLDYVSYYDTLTGLPNRTLFIDRASQQMHGRSGEQSMVAMILIDLERFRIINETLGRHGGDELLMLVARRLERAFHGKDYLARIGADVFGVSMRGICDAAGAAHAAEKQILECFREPFVVSGTELRVAAKAGVAMFPVDGQDADTLFRNAEAAVKRARSSGDRYLFYAAEMNAQAAQALSLETRLRKAVEARHFVLHYQPKFELATGRICGMEALIRWQEPGSGPVPPGSFIPLLEETGLILEVGQWVLRRALADHRAWTARGCTVPRIAVNVSAIQLQKTNFTEMVINAVRQAGDIPEALELEITESMLMRDVQATICKLSILRELGIRIAMDDFGTGYSSLSYIARLPIDSVKIDRSFVNGMGTGPQDMAIVTTIVALARSLNLKVVAEGVETEEQRATLAALKCDEAQGYLFSKPVPAEQIEALLRAPVVEKPQETSPANRGNGARSPQRSKRVPQRPARKR